MVKFLKCIVNRRSNRKINLLLVFILFCSCATKHVQFGSKVPIAIKDNFDNPTTVSHTFYLIGDAGNSDKEKSKSLFYALKERLVKADSSSTLIFLGDNIYPKGIPSKNNADRKLAEEKLNNQLALTEQFKGNTIFIPGNHDWYSGLEGLKTQEKMVNDYFKSKKAFLPRRNCAIDHVDINANLSLIVIDSEWFLEDWNEHPTINEDCDIKTREQFFTELENQLNKNQKKTTIIAMHHPLISGGAHGGQFSWEKQLFPFESKIPLPLLGTAINLLRKTAGISLQDLQNKKYNTLIQRIKTLIKDKKNVVVVSGHEHNLQYIDQDNIKQIISGAGSKEEAARAIRQNDFSFGHQGYAVLQILKTGATKVAFYGLLPTGKEVLLFKQQPLFARPKPNLREFPSRFVTTKDTSIYTLSMTKKSRSYRFLWGNHFRNTYSLPIKAKVASLDTLFGGLKPTIEDSERESKSLLLTDKNGDEYVMRALKKSATQYLQSVAFKNQSVEKDFKDTYTENFILDFYTTSHPYIPLIVGKLAGKIGVNHTNPKLYYIPKQNTLGLFNEDFGNELYLIEERPMNGFSNLRSFGKPPKIVGTEEVLTNIQLDVKYEVDQKAYIRARLFDMLIGDWNRNSDQWRWGEYKEKDKIIYRPIPRNREQAFTKYDGNLLKILMNIPAFRNMKSFGQNLKKVKWFNRDAYTLDLALLNKSDEKLWSEQARYIISNLSNAEIDKAFESLPNEVNGESIAKIKTQLKIRKTHLESYAHQYYLILQKTAILVGTEKKDKFVITRKGNATKVETYTIKNEESTLIQERTYSSKDTKELWIYSLGGEDVFEVSGKSGKNIKIRLLGGLDNDTYKITGGKKISVYDFKSKASTIQSKGNAHFVLSDNYEVNTYDYKKPKYNVFAGYPLMGFNPDDGVKIGAVVNYTVNGFHRFPYSQRHVVKGNYYFATSGFELSYKGTFPHFAGKWNLILDGLYTSPNFATNFFGFGNESVNLDEKLKMDYNRVKIRTLKASPALQWIGDFGNTVLLNTSFERIAVEKTPNRYIAQFAAINPDVFYYKNYVDINAKYAYENFDNNSIPTLGMTFSILGGFKVNTEATDRRFPYAESMLGFTYKLVPDGKLVLATVLKGKALLDDQYEFYHAATVGGDLDLRGFRNQRFYGKQSFYQSTDIRWSLGKLQNGLAPVRYGIFGGFDYGRVWLKADTSDKWHQSAGAGIWFNGVSLLTAKAAYFYSSDGGRLSFSLGLGF